MSEDKARAIKCSSEMASPFNRARAVMRGDFSANKTVQSPASLVRQLLKGDMRPVDMTCGAMLTGQMFDSSRTGSRPVRYGRHITSDVTNQ